MQLRRFDAACRNVPRCQAALLRELLSRCARTDFGRDHGLARVRTPEEYRRAVPVGTYKDREPYVQRVLEGQTTALFPPGERVLMFSLTSGTTGQAKHIPVTPRFCAEMRRGFNIVGISALRDHPEGWLRHIVQLSSPMCEFRSPAGLPCGAISGLIAERQKKIVRRMYPVPLTVCAMQDPEAKYYTTLRCSIDRDVGIISTANPSSTLRLIETARAHAERLIRDVAEGTCRPPGDAGDLPALRRFGRRPDLARTLEAGIAADGGLLPRHFWTLAFLANWTGGTLGLYRPRLRELFDDVPVRDIGLLASEGRFTIPMADETAAGCAEIVANFLEFIPAEDAEQSDPPTVLAHEVEQGREYVLVFSNFSGLMRYNLGDRVRVVGFEGQCPIIEFLCRHGQTANITGEKLSERQVVEAIARCNAGDQCTRLVLQGRFGRPPHYELRLEVSDPRQAEQLAASLDEALQSLNLEYRQKRTSGRLGAVRPRRLAAGTLAEEERRRIAEARGRTEQYKHQYLRKEILPETDAPRDRQAAGIGENQATE